MKNPWSNMFSKNEVEKENSAENANVLSVGERPPLILERFDKNRKKKGQEYMDKYGKPKSEEMGE